MERGGGDYRWGVVKIPMPEWGRFPAPLPAAWQLRNADLERRSRGTAGSLPTSTAAITAATVFLAESAEDTEHCFPRRTTGTSAQFLSIHNPKRC